MGQRHPAQFPQTLLYPFRQRLETLAEADPHRFHIRIRQHQVVEQMGEGHPAQRHAKTRHVREVALGHIPRPRILREIHLPLRPMDRPPRRDVPLQRPYLHRLVPPRRPRAQQREQRHALQRRIPFQLAHHPRPVVRERIHPRPMRPRLPLLTRQHPAAFILPCGSLAHPSSRRCQHLTAALAAFLHHQTYLGVLLHSALLLQRTPDPPLAWQSSPLRDRHVKSPPPARLMIVHHLTKILADGGYRGEYFESWIESNLHSSLEVVTVEKGQKTFIVQAWRWVVERTIS